MIQIGRTPLALPSMMFGVFFRESRFSGKPQGSLGCTFDRTNPRRRNDRTNPILSEPGVVPNKANAIEPGAAPTKANPGGRFRNEPKFTPRSQCAEQSQIRR
jgi:hypothetical protein